MQGFRLAAISDVEKPKLHVNVDGRTNERTNISWINQIKLSFLFIINQNVNFECISIAKHLTDLFNAKLIIEYMRKLVRKSYTPVVPIANTCSWLSARRSVR